MGSEEDSGNKQGPSPKSPVQSSKHTAPSSCHIPSSHRPCLCLALPTQEVISSCCLTHQVAPAHAPVLRQRASAREALQDPHLCRAIVVGVVWLLEGSLSRLQASSGQNTGRLGSSLRLTTPAFPGHLLRMWPSEHQGAPTDRWLCPCTEILAFQLLSQKTCGGLNGISRGAASGWGKCLVAQGPGS